MFCSQCGTHVNDGEHFCSNCGTALQEVGAVVQQLPALAPAPGATGKKGSARPKDPYKEQIRLLRLQIRQLKLDLKQINTSMSQARAQYNQTSAFMPWPLRRGMKIFEDINLLEAQPRKEQLQQQIMQLERQLLVLEQQQLAWKQQQGLS